MKFCLVKNKTLTKYDFKHNNITDDGVEAIIEILDTATHVFEVGISEWVNEETYEKLQKALTNNKPKKGKKGKKKKWSLSPYISENFIIIKWSFYLKLTPNYRRASNLSPK